MKIQVERVLSPRYGRQCFIFENKKEDFIIVYGSLYREVVSGELYNDIRRFEESGNWSRLFTRIKIDRDKYMNVTPKTIWKDSREIKKQKIDVETIYADGEKINDLTEYKAP